MALPIMQTDNTTVQLMQTAWAKEINPVLKLPLNSGVLLKSIALASGVNNLNHTLGRNLQGWFIVRQRGAATIYDQQDSNSTPNLTLVLNSSTGVKVDLLVF